MSLAELEKYVNSIIKEKNDNCCLICYLGNETECSKLSCGHYYHQKCLGNLKNCPYCNKKITVKKLNKKIVLTQNENICKTILKTGKRKGEECGRNNCKYHVKI